MAHTLSVECFPLNKPTSYLSLCLSLNSFCNETSRTWASLSPETRCVISVGRPWVLAAFESQLRGFKSQSGFWPGWSPSTWVRVPSWGAWYHNHLEEIKEEESPDSIYNSKSKTKQNTGTNLELCKTYMRKTIKHSYRTKSRFEQMGKYTMLLIRRINIRKISILAKLKVCKLNVIPVKISSGFFFGFFFWSQTSWL